MYTEFCSRNLKVKDVFRRFRYIFQDNSQKDSTKVRHEAVEWM